MKRVDLTQIPIANKNIDEFRKLNIKNILELEFNINQYKEIKNLEFKFLKESNFNYIIYINGKIRDSKLESNILIKENKIEITKEIKESLVVLNYYDEQNIYFENSLNYKINENINTNIIEIFQSKNKENFINEKRVFEINKFSNLEYIKVQKLSNEDFLNIVYETNILESSHLKFFNFDYGSKNSYNHFDIDLNHSYSSFVLNAIVNIKDNQELANIIKISHNEKNTTSSAKVNHILKDNAHGVFEAKTVVNKNAKYSKVLQNSKTTILSDNAKINANPRLEIFTDELSASHGATSGSIDEDILYYLQTRGLSKDKASKIVLDALENSIFDEISNEDIKSFIKNFIKEK